MAASSSSCFNHEGEKYEVFISFGGDDVRHNFLSHLFAALKGKQIHAFMDDNLERGKDITGALFRIIEESDLSIVIFSQNYPKSKWCLKELEKIHECMKQREHIVVPIFYKVNPSDVQQLLGNYTIEVEKHRDALVEISNLSGFDSNNYLVRNDVELIDAIVNDVSKKLSGICPSTSHDVGLFGINSCIKDVESLLCIESVNDVRMVGIWGMGGIGKTTIAGKVFDRIRKKFQGHCFVSNVREKLSTNHELKDLREKIIRELLRDKTIKLDSSHSIDPFIQRRLRRIKVLIVLDDVHTCMQLKCLLEDTGLYPNSFCPGSRIIVTSRDWQVLENVNMQSVVYQAMPLKVNEALKLFSWHAFGQNNPSKPYEKLSQKVVQYANGVPLALVVLGSEFKHKTTRYWEDAMRKFETTNPLEIQKILRVSFDGLDGDEKNIFLDIACFLRGEERNYVENVLEAFGFHSSIGINRLIDKSLITIDRDECIEMHDLLQQMGQEIVVEEKQNRLWTIDDITDTLTNNKGNENVEAISLRVPYKENETQNRIDISPRAFYSMCKLRFLRLQYPFDFPMGLEFLPGSIRYLDLLCYPLNYLPSDSIPVKLVGLNLIFSNLEQIIWNKPLKYLKRVNLAYSGNLVRILDLAMAPNLEVLNLTFCYSLVEIGSCLENLNKLTRLNVVWCRSLSHLPEIPCSIKELELRESGIRQLPSTIGRLTHLKELLLDSCVRLGSLPNSICNLISIERLGLSNCRNLNQLPENFGDLKSLKKLDASYSGLRALPLSITNLKKLIKLYLIGCDDLLSLPALPSNLEVLDAENCASAEILLSCPKLKHVGSSIMEQNRWEAHYGLTKMSDLYIQGSEVPMWMMYRNNSGSSISLEPKLVGSSGSFIFCVVISSNASPNCSRPVAILANEFGETYSSSPERRDQIGKETINVFLWNFHHVRCTNVKRVSFSSGWSSTHGEIIKCGVHPIYSKRKQPNYRI